MALGIARFIGFIGSAFMLSWLIYPIFGGALAISGLIFVLIAAKKISETMGKNQIFRDFLIASIFLFPFLILSSAFIAVLRENVELVSQLFSILVHDILALWILLILASFFLRKSLKLIAETTNVPLFKISANTYLLSAILLPTIIGFLILFLAIFLQALAFLFLTSPKKTSFSAVK
jgi:uncharacterized membrane protein